MPGTSWTSAGDTRLGMLRRYGMALLINFFALLLTWLLLPFVERSVFIFFFAAVALNVWYAGPGSAILTIGFALASVGYIFLPPTASLAIGAQGAVPLIVFTAIATLIITLTEARRRAEVQARMEAARFRVTLASIGDAVIVTDTIGRITFINDVAATLIGCAPADAVGRDSGAVLETIDPATRQPVASPVLQVLREHRVLDLAHHSVLIARDGTERPIATSAAPIRDSGGPTTGVVIVLRDMTEQVAAERERAELLSRERASRHAAEDALQHRDRFLSLAAHELKTPLTAILGNIELFRRRASREPALSERQMRYFAVIAGQTQRLSTLVGGLLDVSRIELGQLTIEHHPVDVEALARQVVDEIHATVADKHITFGSEAQPLIISGDALRLEQVLHNLIYNAVKYSGPATEIRVDVEQREQAVCVTVRDSGVGIPAAALPHVFERFFRAPNVDNLHISGTGIGLYVVKELVGMHGGSVTVASVEGEGSTFTVALPLAGQVTAPPA